MNTVLLNRYPEGKKKAVTMSYDDGRVHDRKLVDIFNRYGVKGSFHLNSGMLGEQGYISQEEVKELYEGHEIGAHTYSHPNLMTIPEVGIIEEVVSDKKILEGVADYPIRGMSYPYGYYNERIMALVGGLNMEYARSIETSGGFNIHRDFMKWRPTCHHNDDLLEKAERFLKDQRDMDLRLLYVWGHSYEFENDGNWDMIEKFCQMLHNIEELWFATGIEVVSYVKDLQRLIFSSERDIVYNPTASDLWLTVNNKCFKIQSGETRKLS